MKRKLLIEIDCGEEHCGSCEHCIRRLLDDEGRRDWYCHLYSTEDRQHLVDLKLDDEDTPLRCAECKVVEAPHAAQYAATSGAWYMNDRLDMAEKHIGHQDAWGYLRQIVEWLHGDEVL